MIRVPGDKSISHRALLLAALGSGTSRLSGVLPGADCRSTARILRQLGVAVPRLPDDGSPFEVEGVGLRGMEAPASVLDCGNSGTTARLLLGLLSGLSVEAALTGDDSLRTRPMARVTEPLTRAGARFREEGKPGRLPIRILGPPREPIRHRSTVASAQVKSALLLAGLGAGLEVEVVEPVPSRDHSERMLRRVGVGVRSSGEAPHEVALAQVPGSLDSLDLQVPGDISSAAFLLVLGLLGGRSVEIANVGLNPTRTGILGVLERMGAELGRENLRETDDPAGEPAGDLTARPTSLRGVEVEGPEIPSLIDEIPVLAVAAARARGTTVIRDAAELRVKESDRLRALAVNLAAVGVEVEELPDGLVIEGSDRPLEGRVRSFHDHRIAMAFGVLGALPENNIELDDRSVVDVSFPGFWELLDGFAGSAGGGAATRPGSPARPGSPTRPEPPPPPRPVVTIDGPAGSGKSTTARAVAQRLGFRHLDSGALYRAATLALQRSGIPEGEWSDRGIEHLQQLEITLTPADSGFDVRIDGESQGEALRSAEVTARVARVAAIPEVRTLILEPLRRVAGLGGVVADGRDMGSVVLPDADLKVYLTASLAERARRRLLQEGVQPDAARLEEAARQLAERDAADRSRPVAPLRRPPDAVSVDTTGLAFSAQVDRIVEEVKAAIPDLTEPTIDR